MFNKQKEHGGRISRRSKLRWGMYFLIGLMIPASYALWTGFSYINLLFLGFQPPEMMVAQYSDRTIRANLGGMPVDIPKHFAEYVEYSGDPGFGEKRNGPPPVRTAESRLRSFGMDVRFPDMKGLENAQLREEKRRLRLKDDPWLHVGIIAGDRYSGDGFMDRWAHGTLSPVNRKYWWATYERLPADAYGLEAYVVPGNDPRDGRPARESDDTDDIFIHRQSSGQVDTYVICGRIQAPGGVAICHQVFSLEPKAKVEVTVRFRRGLLPEWQQMQASVRRLLLSFEVKNPAIGAAKLIGG